MCRVVGAEAYRYGPRDMVLSDTCLPINWHQHAVDMRWGIVCTKQSTDAQSRGERNMIHSPSCKTKDVPEVDPSLIIDATLLCMTRRQKSSGSVRGIAS
jgi:hypothetical protein